MLTQAYPHYRVEDDPNIAFCAMLFAKEMHAEHFRKYTKTPYTEHLAEVAGIVACVTQEPEIIAVAWLHDCVEDQVVTHAVLLARFGRVVADGVMMLSDMETGNRAARKAAARVRLAGSPAWIQTIKVADIISNTSSIVQHDPKFAKVYLEEKRLLLDVLVMADRRLLALARATADIVPTSILSPPC